jgi:hypothetical protein
MCLRVQCERCLKPSWKGCGKHVEKALSGVEPSQRCRCREALHEPEKPASRNDSAMADVTAAA